MQIKSVNLNQLKELSRIGDDKATICGGKHEWKEEKQNKN